MSVQKHAPHALTTASARLLRSARAAPLCAPLFATGSQAPSAAPSKPARQSTHRRQSRPDRSSSGGQRAQSSGTHSSRQSSALIEARCGLRWGWVEVGMQGMMLVCMEACVCAFVVGMLGSTRMVNTDGQQGVHAAAVPVVPAETEPPVPSQPAALQWGGLLVLPLGDRCPLQAPPANAGPHGRPAGRRCSSSELGADRMQIPTPPVLR